eukprot:c5179_g1_i2.p1 GENE.c5179_g1_i2~~c5179_g1_i2.p1  ORF type:complete len:162 (+),score=38.42 c5179_g1_i2:705-1190(+)
MWWAIQTVTIVGYGDLVPVKWPSRVVAMMTMISGVLFVALPLSTVSSSFVLLFRIEKSRSVFARLFQQYSEKFGLSRDSAVPLLQQPNSDKKEQELAYDAVVKMEQALCSIKARLFIMQEGLIPDADDPRFIPMFEQRIINLNRRLHDLEDQVLKMGIDLA